MSAKARVQVISYTNGMVPTFEHANTVEELLKAKGLNGDTVVNVNGTMKYDSKLSNGDVVMFSKGSTKSA
jgi:hypothetical protein